jgi:hypothetical protein
VGFGPYKIRKKIMANDTNIKSKFFGPNAGNTQITATNSTNLAAEQDPADGADLTLAALATNGAMCGPGFAQQIKLVSGGGDDNSDVTYTVVGTDVNGVSQTEDIVGGAGGATVTSVLFYRTLTKVTGNGAATVDISMGTVGVFTAPIFTGRTRVRGFTGVAVAGNLEISSVSTTGTVEMQTVAAAGAYQPHVPHNGILCPNGAFLGTNTNIMVGANTGLTVYFDG